MGREIRRVPKKWEHPRTFDGSYKPLMDDYIGSLKYYKKSVDDFIKYMTEVVSKGKVKIYDMVYKTPQEVYAYLTEDGQMNPPEIEDYMPSGEWYQLFENVSEGTPLSPAFEKPEDLVEWLSNNNDFWNKTWTREQAEEIVKQGFAMSGVISNGKFYNPQESLLLPTQGQVKEDKEDK